MNPTNTQTQNTKEDAAFKAGEMRQAARDYPYVDPVAPETAPTISERVREGYEEAKESVMHAAHDLKEKVAPTQPSTSSSGAYRDSANASTTTNPFDASSVTGETHPSISERLRESYEGAKDTVLEKAHELRVKLTPAEEAEARATTTTATYGEPRMG